MSRLEEIKQNHAVSMHFNSWEDLLLMSVSVDKNIDVVCKQYAKEVAQASLEKASEKGTIDYSHNEGYSINEESITNKENIILL